MLYVLTSPAVNVGEALQSGCSNIYPKVGIYLPPTWFAFQTTANFISTAVRTLNLTNCLHCHEIVWKTGLNYQVRKLSLEIRNGYSSMPVRIVKSLAALSPIDATTKTKKNVSRRRYTFKHVNTGVEKCLHVGTPYWGFWKGCVFILYCTFLCNGHSFAHRQPLCLSVGWLMWSRYIVYLTAIFRDMMTISYTSFGVKGQACIKVSVPYESVCFNFISVSVLTFFARSTRNIATMHLSVRINVTSHEPINSLSQY